MDEKKTMNARENVLGAIRASLGEYNRNGVEIEDRIAKHVRNTIPARAVGSMSDCVERFVNMASSVDTTFTRVTAMADVPAALCDYLTREKLPAKVVMAPDQDLDKAPWQEVAPQLEIRRGASEDTDRVSVTSATAGVAETGTLVMLSGPDHPSTLNFLPEIHVVVLPTKRIVGAYEDAWDKIRARATVDNDLLPRTVNHITGPSRSGDIEQTILLGAHGPRRLHVILVGDDGA